QVEDNSAIRILKLCSKKVPQVLRQVSLVIRNILKAYRFIVQVVSLFISGNLGQKSDKHCEKYGKADGIDNHDDPLAHVEGLGFVRHDTVVNVFEALYVTNKLKLASIVIKI